jgi:uncharacterized protein with HEPN domain
MAPTQTERLQHIRDAAVTAVSFTSGRLRADLDKDILFQYALVRAIEIIGEAATHLSGETRANFPSVPWREWVGMRNRLIHGYFSVDLDILWNTVTQDLPPLIAAFAALELPPPPSAPLSSP